jgi:hypothetical protein
MFEEYELRIDPDNASAAEIQNEYMRLRELHWDAVRANDRTSVDLLSRQIEILSKASKPDHGDRVKVLADSLVAARKSRDATVKDQAIEDALNFLNGK